MTCTPMSRGSAYRLPSYEQNSRALCTYLLPSNSSSASTYSSMGMMTPSSAKMGRYSSRSQITSGSVPPVNMRGTSSP